MLEKILDCPNCGKRFHYECDGVIPSEIICPECHAKSRMEDYAVLIFCSKCHAKLKIPLSLLEEPDIMCPECNAVLTRDLQEIYEGTSTIEMMDPRPRTEQKRLFAEGDLFDKYRIERFLGKGGMAEVYLTKHLLLKHQCALKLMLRGLNDNVVFIKRFIREAKLANRINHPNIVRVYDAGNDPRSGMLFLAMEYVEGKNLQEIIRERTFSEAELWEILISMAKALKALAEFNVVHRDIKPSNIMKTIDGSYKLMDLGIAKSEYNKEFGEVTLTVDQSAIGTPAYASPEQCCSAHNVDIRSDIYCLGATLYHLASGKIPFRGETPVEIIINVMQSKAEPLSKSRPDLSPGLIGLIKKMMEKDPNNRPATPDELLELAAKPPSNSDVKFRNCIDFIKTNRKRLTIAAVFTIAILAEAYLFFGKDAKHLNSKTETLATHHISDAKKQVVQSIPQIPEKKNNSAAAPAPKKQIVQSIPKTPEKKNNSAAAPAPKKQVVQSIPQIPEKKNNSAAAPAPKKRAPIREFTEMAIIPQKQAVTLLERIDHVSERLIELQKSSEGKETPAQKKFRNFQIKVRKEQLERLMKQHKVRDHALTLKKKTDIIYPETREFQKKFNEYTALKSDWGYSGKDIKFSREIISQLKSGKVDPNVVVSDVRYKRYSGPLIFCILSGRIQLESEITRVLLELGADTTPVTHKQLSASSKDAVKLILTEGGYDDMKKHLIVYAKFKPFDKKVISDLLYLDHNVTELDRDGNTILHYAAEAGAEDIITLIVALDGDVNARNKKGETPLFLAIKNGFNYAAKRLIELGTDTSIRNAAGKTAAETVVQWHFLNAVRNGNVQTAKDCLKRGANVDDIDVNGNAALHTACMKGDAEMVSMLLESGANANINQTFGRRCYPLQLVIERKYFNEKIIELLLKAGADPNIPPQGYGGTTLLASLCSYWSNRLNPEQKLKLLKLLLSSPKTKLSRRYNNQSYINGALYSKLPENFILEFLKHIKEFSQNDAVLNSAISGNRSISIIQELIRKKANVNAVSYNKTPLWLAVEKNNAELINLLISHGADLEWKNSKGESVRDLMEKQR